MTPQLADRLALPEVTLCAATSVNVKATVLAIEACLAHIDFAACKLFTHANIVPENPAITVVPIPRISSATAYCTFILSQLVNYIDTDYCLISQWDGHVIDAGRWLPEFLDYDYIGASWPQFADRYNVGNGGFSLRSKQLMEACKDPRFRNYHPEDVLIGRVNRDWLEEQGMRFAPQALADIFSSERAGDPSTSFGYHGVWHMPEVIGIEAFWRIYGELDNRDIVEGDFAKLRKRIWRGPHGLVRALQMTADRAKRQSTGTAMKLFDLISTKL